MKRSAGLPHGLADRGDTVRVVGIDGADLGLMIMAAALKLAADSQAELLVVEPKASPPVVRIAIVRKLADLVAAELRHTSAEHGSSTHADAADCALGVASFGAGLIFYGRSWLTAHRNALFPGEDPPPGVSVAFLQGCRVFTIGSPFIYRFVRRSLVVRYAPYEIWLNKPVFTQPFGTRSRIYPVMDVRSVEPRRIWRGPRKHMTRKE